MNQSQNQNQYQTEVPFNELAILNSMIRMNFHTNPGDSTASAVSLSRIYFILSDPDCVKMLQMISEDIQPKVSDIGSRQTLLQSNEETKGDPFNHW